MYCDGRYVVKSHTDAQKLIEHFNTPLTTHFYETDFSTDKGYDHLPSTAEAQEFLDLLLELAKTFPQDNNPEFIRISNIDFQIALGLMQMAKVELSEHDKKHILNYATTELFDCEYLNYANQIRDAWTVVNNTADFWESIVRHESYCAEYQNYEDKLNTTPRWRLIKRFRLAYKECYWSDEIRSHAALLIHNYGPRALRSINEVYQTDLKYGFPLVFYHPPKLIKGQSLFNDEIAEQAQHEWETCALHTQFGDEKFARLVDLMPSFCQSVWVYIPGTEKDINSFTECTRYYPEIAPYYHLLRNNIWMAPSDGHGWGRFDKDRIEHFNKIIAEAFHCEEYLDQANTTSRPDLLPADNRRPEDYMSPTELKTAQTILRFMESTS